MESVQKNIEKRVSRLKKGELIFPTDFRGLGSTSAIKMALSRLTANSSLRRLSHGIYYIPKVDKLFGELRPDPEQVALAIARKEKMRIMPTGSQALHSLGLTTQVPTRRVYLTDGHPRKITIGKQSIEFRHTTPKKISFKGKLSGLVILALMEIGTENLDDQVKSKIREILLQENQVHLKHDLQLAPGRIHDFLVNLIDVKNDGMVKSDGRTENCFAQTSRG